MVAGGLTFAVPGTDPVFAQTSTSNQHLYVSADGQDPDNMFAQGNIIEIIINDDTIGDTDEGEAEPDVTVNGADLRMLQNANGDWRAYIAEVDAIAGIDGNGNELDYGEYCSENAASAVSTLELTDGNGVYFPPGSVAVNADGTCVIDTGDPTSGHPLIRQARALTDYDPSGDTLGQLGLADANLWPFIQVFDFTSLGDVKIVYSRGGSQETVTLTFDDPSESHKIDRTTYPQGAYVNLNLTDYALNIDPTDEDTWSFDTANGKAYYNLFDEDGNPVNILRDSINSYGGDAGIDETVSIDRDPQGSTVIDCSVTQDFGIKSESVPSQDYLESDDAGACVPTTNIPSTSAARDIFTPDSFVIQFVEDGSNRDTFVNYAEDNRFNLVIREDAPRGNSFVVDYSSPDAKSGIVGHFFAKLDLDVPDDTWNSGERIPIVLTDGDANVNPRDEDDLTVANPHSLLVPSIRIGEPVTLASATGDVIWFDVLDPLPADTTDPVITVNSGTDRINVGDAWTDAGATCVDARDGTLSVTVGGDTIDNSTTAGSYGVTYTCTDAANNSVTETRPVTVVDPTVDNPPTINFGTQPATERIDWNTPYAVPDLACTDDRADSPTLTITVTAPGGIPTTVNASDSLNTRMQGDHTILYSCTDGVNQPALFTIRVTVGNPPPATLNFDVTASSWDKSKLNLTIIASVSSPTQTVELENAVLTFPGYSSTMNVVDGAINNTRTLTDITVAGDVEFTLSANGGSLTATDTVTIDPILALADISTTGGWSADNGVFTIPLGLDGSSGAIRTDLVLDNEAETLVTANITFGGNGVADATLTAEALNGLYGNTGFKLKTERDGSVATSAVRTASISALLELDRIKVGSWSGSNIPLEITGSNATNLDGNATDATPYSLALQFKNATGWYTLDASNSTAETSNLAAHSDGVINGTASVNDISLRGATEFRLLAAIGNTDADDPTLASTSTSANIPTTLLLNQLVDTNHRNNLKWTGGNIPINVTGQVAGLADAIADAVVLQVYNGTHFNNADSEATPDPAIANSNGALVGTNLSVEEVGISGTTATFRLAATAPDISIGGVPTTVTAVSNEQTLRIPHALTLDTVTVEGDWAASSLTLEVNGTSGVGEEVILEVQSYNGTHLLDEYINALPATVFVDLVTDEPDDPANTADVELVNITYQGLSPMFRLNGSDGDVITDSVRVDIPTVIQLGSVQPALNAEWVNGSANTDPATYRLHVGAALDKLAAAADVRLMIQDDDGDFNIIGGNLNTDTMLRDGVDVVQLPDNLYNTDGNTQVFRLDVVDNTATPPTTITSSNVFSTAAIPAPPEEASGTSADMIPTPVSFSANAGFPPITRAVINAAAEIPQVHDVQAASQAPVAIYTWSGDDKTVEAYSDRLRLNEPADRNAITGMSKIVIYGWEPPTFATGVTTLFNWNFGSILSDGVAAGTTVTDVRLANADHSQSVSLGNGESGLEDITAMKADIEALGDTVDLVIMLENTDLDHVCGDITLVADFFTFGQTPDGDRINDAIYRIEVEEASSNSDEFEGTVEYTMLNQLNIDDPATYTGLRTISDEISIIVHEDFTDEDSVRVNYLDLGADGVSTQIAIQQAAPTHSAVVSFDAESYKIADTVTITLDDADLNVKNDVIDIYTFSSVHTDTIGDDGAFILDVTFDDELWTSGNCAGADGFSSTGFTLQETASNSGVFTGDFQIPEVYCQSATGDIVSVTGVDIEVNYQDFRDASGEEIETGAGAAIRANTGTVSLDRTVYPVPFAADSFRLDAVGNDEYLDRHDLTVHVTIDDPDFDISAAGEDVIANATEYLTVKVIRGSSSNTIDLESASILETAPDSGAFELDLTIGYDDGPENQNGPNRILQGDILQVEYTDPTDASGEPNTVTDSATFDLRNGVLQSDKSVYIIGSDMILTLIEPDFDLDDDGAESYTLNLIEWDSDAATLGMNDPVFDPEPSELRETGDSTGIFQVIAEIPAEIDGDRLERGEEIELEYVDYGPSGSDYVGEESEDVNLTVYTSNFGATIELDQKVYTWTDKVYITIVAPDHNFDSALVDEIGDSNLDPIQVSTRSADIDNYKLVETGPDTGIFTGEVILIGFDHNADGDTETGTAAGYDNPARSTSQDGSGPTNGYLQTDDDDGITVSFEYSEDETVVGSALIRWNIGEVQWLESSYPASGTGVVRVIDPDMNWNPEAVDNFVVDVWSDADNGGIDLTVTETNEATGIFEGTVFFTITDESSGHRLRVAEGNTVTAEYEDNTLPDPYTTADELDITATTLIGTIVPPLERAPATNLRIVDAFGNSLDAVSADQQVQIVADLANGQDRSQAFAYLVQVQDANGVTVALSWISGTLEAGQSLSPSTSWIPSDSGAYTATAFVWESVDNPTALSPPVTTDINVS